MKVSLGAQWTSLKTPWQKEPAADQKPRPPISRAVLQNISQEMSQVSLQQVCSPSEQNMANNVPSRSGVFLPSVYKSWG